MLHTICRNTVCIEYNIHYNIQAHIAHTVPLRVSATSKERVLFFYPPPTPTLPLKNKFHFAFYKTAVCFVNLLAGLALTWPLTPASFKGNC